MSQAKLAYRVGKSQSWLVQIEGGTFHPYSADARKLAVAMGVRYRSLFEDTGSPIEWIVGQESDEDIQQVHADVGIGSAPTGELPRYRLPVGGDRAHWVRVVGNCMEPFLKHGDLVWVDPDAERLPGKLVTIVKDGDSHICRLVQAGDLLRCVNNDGEFDTREIEITGVVLGKFERLNADNGAA